MQFHIPQYIDIEDKLIGPLTLKQGLFIGGGMGGAYLVFRIIPSLYIAAPLILGIVIFTWALAFYPKEKLGKTFLEILEAAFMYMIGDKLYTWKKTTQERRLGEEEIFMGSQTSFAPTFSTGKLSDASSTLSNTNMAPKVGEVERHQEYKTPFVPSIRPVAPPVVIVLEKGGGFKAKKY